MATELETPVDSSQQSLERGTQLLAMLRRAAVAARLEAQVAELDSAVCEARRGVSQRLERWLKDFDAAQHGQLLFPSCAPAPELPSTPILETTAAASARLSGWDSYLPHAEHRLRQRPSSTLFELQHLLREIESI